MHRNTFRWIFSSKSHFLLSRVLNLPQNGQCPFKAFEFLARWLWKVLTDGNELGFGIDRSKQSSCPLKDQIRSKGKKLVIPWRELIDWNPSHSFFDAFHRKGLIRMFFAEMIFTYNVMLPSNPIPKR